MEPDSACQDDARGGPALKLEHLVEKLERLGFDNAEATIYVKLLQNGPSRASTLASLSDLNRTKVYRVLDDLVDRRFASASVGRPTIYQAEDPEAVFGLLREDIRSEERTLDRIEGELLDPLEEISDTGHEVDRPDWKLIEGYPRIYDTLHRLIHTAEEEIVLVSNHAITTNLVPFVEEAWEEATERASGGVNFRALLDLDACQGERVERWFEEDNVEVRHRALEEHVHFVLIDQEQVLQWLVMDPEGSVQMDEGAAILSDAPGLVTAASLLAENLWAGAEPASARKAERA